MPICCSSSRSWGSELLLVWPVSVALKAWSLMIEVDLLLCIDQRKDYCHAVFSLFRGLVRSSDLEA